MKSILLLAFSNLKHRKKQNLLIGIIILVATLSFTIGLSVLFAINAPFERAFEAQKGAHLNLTYSTQTYESDSLIDFWSKQPEIEAVSQPMVQISEQNTCYFAGKPTVNSLYYTEVPLNPTVNLLRFVEGNETPQPLPNQVWLTTSFANKNGISVGDTILFGTSKGTLPYTVGALVIDLPYNSGFMNPVRAWFAHNELTKNFPAEDITTGTISIRFKDFSDYNRVWQRFEDYLGQPFSGLKLDKTLISSAYSIQVQIMGSILLLFSIIAIMIALYVLVSTINNAILQDYKLCGVYKSLGLTPSNIAWLFTFSYSLLGFIAIPIGAFLGFLLSQLLTKSLMDSLGILIGIEVLIVPVLLASFVIAVILTLVAVLVSQKAGKVKAAEAIRIGNNQVNTKSTFQIPLHHFPELPMSMLLSLKELLTNKRQGLFTFITLLTTALVMMFSIITYNSLGNMGKNASFWGMDSSDLQITFNSSADLEDYRTLEDYLTNQSDVTTIVTSEYVVNSTLPKTSLYPSEGIIGVVYGGDLDAIGLINIEGKNPIEANEIAIASNTSKKYQLNVGDSMVLYLEGIKKDFVVTGIYQGVNNLGQGFRVNESAMLSVHPDYHAKSYLVKTTHITAMELLYKSLKTDYQDTLTLTKTLESFESTTKTITSSMGMGVLIMSAIFLTVSLVTIYNSTLLHINKHKSTYGVLKSIGLSGHQIRLSISQKYLLLSIMGGFLAIPLAYLLTHVVMTSLLSIMGITSFPIMVNPMTLFLVIPIIALFSLFSSYHASNAIKQISPRDLLLE